MVRFIPLFVLSEHRVQDSQKFTYTGNQSDFFGFSRCKQPRIKCFYHRIKAGCDKCGDIKRCSDSAPSAKDGSSAAPSLPRLISAELWLFFLYADYNAAMVVALTEIMPPAVRATGFSMAYSLATAIFGGFTPAIASVLINESGIMHCLVIAGSVIRVDGRVAFAKILSGRRPQRGLLITRDEDPASEVIYT